MLIFNNNLSNPFQKWTQGRWFVYWLGGLQGEHTCTLFVSVAIQENKVKPRKGQNIGWHKVLIETREVLNTHTTYTIAILEGEHTTWHKMAGLGDKRQPLQVAIAHTPDRHSAQREKEFPPPNQPTHHDAR
jgi:hypothetical protein